MTSSRARDQDEANEEEEELHIGNLASVLLGSGGNEKPVNAIGDID